MKSLKNTSGYCIYRNLESKSIDLPTVISQFRSGRRLLRRRRAGQAGVRPVQGCKTYWI